MPSRNLPTRVLLAAAVAAVLAVLLVPLAASATTAATPRHPFLTAIGYTQVSAPDQPLAFDRVKKAGAFGARVTLYWPTIAPTRPKEPTNPADPAYSWSASDGEIKRIAARGLSPLVMVYGTPKWAEAASGGAGAAPTTAALAAFTKAAVARYSGDSQALPRVRYWQLWAEPNIDRLLSPQFSGSTPVAAGIYRAMVNVFAPAVHAVPGNIVIAGGLAPFAHTGKALTAAPLRFMRAMLCMSAAANPRPTCAAKTSFDIWAIHPYTNGSPWHKALNRDDVSIPEIPQMEKLVQAAVSAGHVVGAKPVRYWVTEFSWDSNPPVSFGVPPQLEAQWVSEAFYRMWSFKIELVTWLSLRDVTGAPAGLYFGGSSFADDRPKPALAAFRFPFVAYPQKGRVLVWGRTPDSKAATVTIQRKSGSAWKSAATVKADRFGVFTSVLRTSPKGVLRARVASGSASLAFAVKAPKDVALRMPALGGGRR
ncbi:MAG: hypothetical protein QOE36_3002 [Gaiellaceae bacterium]|nr:hypothetical protein [Gaiellaceae bacterium]